MAKYPPNTLYNGVGGYSSTYAINSFQLSAATANNWKPFAEGKLKTGTLPSLVGV